ncbi:MAG: aminotransferase class V-fold PLP-dependent enzyme [Sphingomonadales bacterium]|nr:aminotransferase class V-fold PLP-dependent enzyme [Sphingomonadales bacterium]
MTRTTIYLDHAATTPLRPEAREAMAHGFDIWANPSSPHAAGRRARAALEDARERILDRLKWDGELLFTSGASEAAMLALGRAHGSERLLSAVEHDAVLAAAPGAPRLAVLGDGAVDQEALEAILARSRNPVVAIQSINSETGNAQNLGDLVDCVHDAGGLIVADCSQSAGKYPLPHEVDMAILAAHKFGGPVGVGALLVRDYAMLDPAGGQERGYRRGTENLPGILAMAAALDACDYPYGPAGTYQAVMQLADAVRAAGGHWLGDRLDTPSAYIHALAMPGLSGSAQLMRFDMAGIAVSQGSACSSGSMRRSPVLTAMGIDDDLADRTIRLSTGWNTTVAEIERFAEIWLAMATQVRAT